MHPEWSCSPVGVKRGAHGVERPPPRRWHLEISELEVAALQFLALCKRRRGVTKPPHRDDPNR
jgi:hypothetical protein